MKQDTFIYSATKGKKEDTLLWKSLNAHDIQSNAYFCENNSKSLASTYNRAIDFAISNDVENLILCHDDITIESGDLIRNIYLHMKEFDVVGVAGTDQCNIKSPALWHMMGGGIGSGNLYRAVAHAHHKDLKSMTSFGPYPHRAVLLDGVFLAINRKVFEKVRFDETNPAGFHHYDLDYCLQCNKAEFKMGVSNILITHASPGLSSLEDVEWNKGNKWFLNKWKK